MKCSWTVFYAIELIDIYSIYLRHTNKFIFGFVTLDICMTKNEKKKSLWVPPMSNKQSIFYLQQKKKKKMSIYKDTLNTFDIKNAYTKNIHCGRMMTD